MSKPSIRWEKETFLVFYLDTRNKLYNEIRINVAD